MTKRMKKIRIACRDSVAAVALAHIVMQAIRDYDPLVVPELVVCKTPADKLSHLPKLPLNLKKAHLRCWKSSWKPDRPIWWCTT